MILLDTNVVSELMRAEPSGTVMDWFAGHDAATLYLSAVSEAELRAGAAILPKSRRRDRLVAAIDAMIEQDFVGRLLAFDSPAARDFAAIVAARRVAGRPISTADCQIAAIARCRRLAVATRNVGDFEGCGVAVLDPWGA